MITTCLPATSIGESDEQVAFLDAVGQRQVLHRLVDACQLASGIGRSRVGGTAGEHDDRIELGAARRPSMSTPDVDPSAELGPSASIWSRRRSRNALLHLELGDAVAQQAADAIGALEHRHVVPGARELLGAARPAGPEPMTATACRCFGGRLRLDPALGPGALDDGDLDLLDGDRVR
jgi:hypothetical protein